MPSAPKYKHTSGGRESSGAFRCGSLAKQYRILEYWLVGRQGATTDGVLGLWINKPKGAVDTVRQESGRALLGGDRLGQEAGSGQNYEGDGNSFDPRTWVLISFLLPAFLAAWPL